MAAAVSYCMDIPAMARGRRVGDQSVDLICGGRITGAVTVVALDASPCRNDTGYFPYEPLRHGWASMQHGLMRMVLE